MPRSSTNSAELVDFRVFQAMVLRTEQVQLRPRAAVVTHSAQEEGECLPPQVAGLKISATLSFKSLQDILVKWRLFNLMIEHFA